MTLAPGVRLGRYEVLSALGSGGMGEVYRARDAKLQRDVALKVLPDLFARDPGRLARFQREAQVLASLNHPNIAQIHGLEESDGTLALVMEFVDGPTLAEIIAGSRALPVADVIAIARQIAEALEAAHEQGITHRSRSRLPRVSSSYRQRRSFGSATRHRRSRRTAGRSSSSPPVRTDGPCCGCGRWIFSCRVRWPEPTGRRPRSGRPTAGPLRSLLRAL